MGDARDTIHQIEYRWHDRRDLSPVASTMSPESLRGWDSWIRAWVRHPHADKLWESVCYQVQPNGRAAIAWRYEDWQAAEREDGRTGRPLVSRVLAGQASLLTPEVAIVLCRTGLPGAAGPRPGRVTNETRLAAVAADDLTALVSERIPELDEEAARQEGLRQVVAAALSRPSTPLAIHVRDTYILRPPGEGVQCPLLWGLRRIVWPLLGTTGRGWSFSTFEPPLGDADPATLPAVLFRQAQDTPPAAPARPRDEIKVRPFDRNAPDDGSPYAELAGWLVAEYQERGGDELRQLITEWCGTEQALQQRLSRVGDKLRGRQSPYTLSGSSSPFVELRSPWSPASAPGPASPEEPEKPEEPQEAAPPPGPSPVPDPWESRAQEYPAAPPGYASEPVYRAAPESDSDFLRENAYPPPQQEMHQEMPSGYAGRGWAAQVDDSLVSPREGSPAPLPERISEMPPQAPQGRHASIPVQPPSVCELLKSLPMAGNPDDFIMILNEIVLNPGIRSDASDRVKARREVSKPEWYGKIYSQYSDLLTVEALAKIFLVIVIPDLDKQDVVDKVAEWAARAHSPVIGGLLDAARRSGDETWQQMMQILQPKLAHRWAIANDMGAYWNQDLALQYASDSGRGRHFWRRG